MASPALMQLLSSRRIRRASALEPALAPARWRLAEISGRVAEISGQGDSAALTTAAGLVLEAQRAGEPVAWVSRQPCSFFPPDLAETGIDLAALVVVRTDGLQPALRAADRLLRSGAFGLVVLDLGRQARLADALQSRLLQLALKHDAVVLCLTETRPEAPSLGSLVSLRAEASRRRVGEGRYACEIHAIKDKRRGPGWRWREVWRGPEGLG